MTFTTIKELSLDTSTCYPVSNQSNKVQNRFIYTRQQFKIFLAGKNYSNNRMKLQIVSSTKTKGVFKQQKDL